MNIEELHQWVAELPGAEDSFPFNQDTLVYKVMNKMFLLVSLSKDPLRINFKATPENNLAYREQYPSVEPAYHMNKKHWSSAYLDGSIPSENIKKWISDSYALVISKLSKKEREKLNQLS